VRVEPGEERGPGGAASGGVVELGEADAVAGEGIEVWRVDFASVATDVGEADVVAEDDEDVGSLGGGCGQGEARDEGSKQGEAEEEGALHGGSLKISGSSLKGDPGGWVP